jgi:hypothetical protein
MTNRAAVIPNEERDLSELGHDRPVHVDNLGAPV